MAAEPSGPSAKMVSVGLLHETFCKALDGRLGGFHVRRCRCQTVGGEEVPLPVRVRDQLLRLELQESRCHGGDPVAGGERGDDPGKNERSEDEREDHEDDLCSDGHEASE